MSTHILRRYELSRLAMNSLFQLTNSMNFQLSPEVDHFSETLIRSFDPVSITGVTAVPGLRPSALFISPKINQVIDRLLSL